MTRPRPLHEKAVAMIEQALHGAYTGREGGMVKEVGSVPVSVRLCPGEDDWSGNLADDHFLRVAGDAMRTAQVRVPLWVSHHAALEKFGPLGAAWHRPGVWEPRQAFTN